MDGQDNVCPPVDCWCSFVEYDHRSVDESVSASAVLYCMSPALLYSVYSVLMYEDQ